MICQNCEKSISQTHKFCPECGQKHAEKLTIGVLFRNTIASYFSFDSRFFKTILPLIFNPGFIAEKFVEGKRQKYLHPIQFYLFISIVFFFLFSFTVRDTQRETDNSLKNAFENTNIDSKKNNNQKDLNFDFNKKMKNDTTTLTISKENEFGINTSSIDSILSDDLTEEDKLISLGYNKDTDGLFKKLLYTQFLKFIENKGQGIIESSYNTISFSLFLLMPLFAFFLMLAFFRNRYYSHHLVFTIYYFTFLFILMTIIQIISFFFVIPSNILFWLFVLSIIHLLFGVIKFYKQSIIRSVIKTSIILFIYLILVLPLSFLSMVIITFLLY